MKRASIKKVTVILVIAFFAGILSVGAQQASDEVNLTVKLAQMQNIEVKTGQENVLLEFTTPEHFQNGVSTSKIEHLAVSSTTAFQVKVNVSGDLTNGQNTIPANTVTVDPVYNSGTEPGDHTLTSRALGTNEETIISATSGAVETIYDIEYTASGGIEYINEAAGDYTTTVFYTISPN